MIVLLSDYTVTPVSVYGFWTTFGLLIFMGCIDHEVPFCGFIENKVIDSRPTDENSIRRRRECLSCQKRFTTYEMTSMPLFVIKDGSRQVSTSEAYKRYDKGVQKRPVPLSRRGGCGLRRQILQNSLEEVSAGIGEI